MKKIMFNDKYGLTQAVLKGRKTMTRRIISNEEAIYSLNEQEYMGQLCIANRFLEKYSRYQIGEIVAIAQPYKEIISDILNYNGYNTEIAALVYKKHKGWNNKMFVKPIVMPHQIKITDLKVERLQYISEEDSQREGILVIERELLNNKIEYLYSFGNIEKYYKCPIEAFAALIDKVSGKGTWDSNPWVFVYEFELVK